MTVRDTLERQRRAFMVELPVSIDVRKDRLKCAAAMIVDHADAFCDALSDFGHRSRDQSMVTDIAGSISPINYALKHVELWARRDKRAVQFPCQPGDGADRRSLCLWQSRDGQDE